MAVLYFATNGDEWKLNTEPTTRTRRMTTTIRQHYQSTRIIESSCNNNGSTQFQDQFLAHDVCFLLPTESKETFESLLRGNNDNNTDTLSFQKLGLIGNVKTPQRTGVHGLMLKVSKKWWAQRGCSNMLVVKVGGTITSLCEFTALCQVGSILLLKYLLASNQSQHDKNNNKSLLPTQKRCPFKNHGWRRSTCLRYVKIFFHGYKNARKTHTHLIVSYLFYFLF